MTRRKLKEASSGAKFSPPMSLWGHSSVGRALEWHSRGRRFDSDWLHQTLETFYLSTMGLAKAGAARFDVPEIGAHRGPRQIGRDRQNKQPVVIVEAILAQTEGAWWSGVA